jgi:hypothetical protein
MGRPRLHKDNAARQKAYRDRKAKAEAPSSGTKRVVAKVMAADAKAQ